MQTHIHNKTAGNPLVYKPSPTMRVEMGLLHTVAQIWNDLGINRTLTCKLARVKPRFYFKRPLGHWDKAGTPAETHAAIYRRAVPNHHARD